MATNIPVKNIKIHRPSKTKDEHYSPRDQIYVRKVTGFFQRLRRKMNFVFLGFLLYYLGYNITASKQFYLILPSKGLIYGV